MRRLSDAKSLTRRRKRLNRLMIQGFAPLIANLWHPPVPPARGDHPPSQNPAAGAPTLGGSRHPKDGGERS